MMRALLFVVVCTAVTAQSAIWDLDLGPPAGGFGLNGQNAGTASPGTGREVKDYNSPNFMRYYDDTRTLELHFGWGAFVDLATTVGGTDLQGDFRQMHIHRSNGDIIYVLSEWDGNAPTPTSITSQDDEDAPIVLQRNGRAAAFDATFDLINNQNGLSLIDQQQELLGGQWYINVHTTAFPGGEVRGNILNAVPEPEHYAAMAGVVLLGFAGYRRFKTARA